MLFRKMLREMRANLGQFFSVFLLSLLAVMIYTGFEANVVGSRKAVERFHEKTKLADLWAYSEGFTQENLEAVRKLDFVEDAGLRTELEGTAPDFEGAQTDIYLEYESRVINPLVVEGDPFIPSDGYKEAKGKSSDASDVSSTQESDAKSSVSTGTKNDVWLNKSFADAWGIKVGDDFKIEYNGVIFTRRVRGLIMTPEYEYTKAEKDADTNFKNLAYVYMSCDAFPYKEFAKRQIETEKITAGSLTEQMANDYFKTLFGSGWGGVVDSNKGAGQTSEEQTGRSLEKDVLLEVVGTLKEEDIRSLMPYTTMLITLTDEASAQGEPDAAEHVSPTLSYEKKISKAIDENYAVMIDADSVIGISRVKDELNQHDTFSYSFAVIFLVIALLVISTTMSRLVERQRTQIGTMNALGMKPYKIALHYMGYSFFVSLLGVIAGFILGPRLLGEAIVNMLMQWYMVPDVSVGVNIMFPVVAMVVVLCCTLTSFFSCRKLMKVPPAVALRPAAPKKAKHTILERLPFWNTLNFRTQYNIRDISRAPMRAVMGIAGTSVGMILVIFSFGCKVLVGDIVDWNFQKLQNFSYEMVLSGDEKNSYYDAIAREVDGEMVMLDEIELSKKQHASASEKSKQSITVIEGKGLYNVTDEKTELMKLTPGSIAVTKRLADSKDIHVGDTIYWHLYSKNKWYSCQVGAINRSPETSGITMLREDLEKLSCEFTPNIIVTDQNVKDYEDREGIAAVYDMNDLKKAFEEGYEVIDVLFYMMMFFSLVTVIVVLYNSGNLSFHERLKEFATLKVMGLSTQKIRGILNQENIWLSVIGIFVGTPFAKPLLLAMMNSNGENFDYYVNIPAALYIAGGAFVLFVAVLVSLLFSKKIRRLDMVETLKGME